MFKFVKKLFHRECDHRWTVKRHTAALIGGQKHPVAVCRCCGSLMIANGIITKRVPLVRY